jgi:3-dehydroquinate dehydratase-2
MCGKLPLMKTKLAGTTEDKRSKAARKARGAAILVLHGPNLNLLGTREPAHYGNQTLADIDAALQQQAGQAAIALECRQSNSEGELIDLIHQAGANQVAFIIINPAAYTHTSIAMRDALAAVKIPFVEVHLSNIYAREAFRQHSYFSDLAIGVISGLGAKGYGLALDFALHHLGPVNG